MNIENVVLVRVFDYAPLNGELIPSCEVKCLTKDSSSEFYFYVRKQIERELETKLGRMLTEEEKDRVLEPIAKEYEVLTGRYYTSTLSFSLNGMVFDDKNNKFATMPVAVLDPIKHHTAADFVNIKVGDTTIKGRLKVSSDAILVVRNDFYKSLSEEEKLNLQSNYKIEFFDNDLNEAVKNTLIKYNYPALPLIQDKKYNYIMDCPEKEEMLEFEASFAASVGASRMILQDLYQQPFFYTEEDQRAHDKVNDDFYNNLQFQEYHKSQLYNFLLAKAESLGIEVTDDEKYYLFTEWREGEDAMKRITTEVIKAYGGLENFKAFIIEYNEYIKNNCLSGVEAISLNGDTRK